MFFSLRVKLLICCGSLVALSAGLASYGLSVVNGATGLVTQVYDEALVSINSAQSAAAKLVAARDLLDRAIASADGEATKQVAALRQASQDIEQDLDVVRDRVHDPMVTKALTAANAARADWMESGLSVLAPSGDGIAALPLPSDRERKGMAASDALADVVDQVAALGFRMRSTATREMSVSQVNMTLAATGIAFGGVLLALGLSEMLLRPIRMATRVAEHVAGGDYTDRIQTQRRDELGGLLTSLASMQANLLGRAAHDRALLNRLRELSDSTFEGLLIHRDGFVLDANSAFCAMVGLSLGQVKGRAWSNFAVSREALQAMSEPGLSAVMESGITMADGEILPVEIQSRDITYADGIARVTALRDIRERLAAEQQTRFLAHHDALTGLPNRSLLQLRLTEFGQDTSVPVALLFLDLDRFKAINDTMGHAAGDALLVEVGRRLVEAAGSGTIVARLGGDEFVVLCRGLDREAVDSLGERIRLRVEAPFEILGRPCHVSASIGIAIAEQAGGLDLVRAADMAMYAAKQGGGNRGMVFEPALYDFAARQFEIEQDLREALSGHDQFVLLYQPVFDVAAGAKRLMGFEALVRWRHPRHGWMSPSQFIPLAETSGLVLPLGEWVMATALRQGHALQRVLPAVMLQIAVNVSALQLVQPGFCSGLADVLMAEGFPPASLCLEVTERIVADAQAAAVLADVRKLGVRVAIDDFGIGYSSLSYLRRLPADVVKLDRSFLEDMEGDLRGGGFVSAVVALAHSAGKTVVMEGIETLPQFDIAAAAGTDMVQGFLFAPPLSEHAALELVIQHRKLDDQSSASVSRWRDS